MQLKYQKAGFTDSEDLTYLHKEVIPLGLLSMLDSNFSAWVYQEVLKNGTAFGFVVKEDTALVGFAAATENSTKVFRSLLKTL